ncbi:AMP-binding protein [Nocardioides daphniae]|uniref:AMP-dependent synthetase n=1 Tax=Nocardioides daphniae TaxID=402297 RepID=A0A4P7UEC1_9ACTN|nr:AMP-binding protein [Nocardioides daphniae]QCC78244.1 AMP-dependent synthetase [Nocardioides daphniae]
MAQLEEWVAADVAPRLLIETSGSTGRPKRVVLTRDAVLASAHASARRLRDLGAGAGGRWALVLPSSYVAGVQVVVRSLVAGHRPVLGAWADEQGAAAYTSLVPTQLHRLMGSPDDVAALAAMQAVLLGGGPIDPALRRAAEKAGIRVVATYGASETAGGCVYDGVPLDGVGVGLGADGRIRLGGPVVFSGYDGDPELTAQTLADGWYLTSDAGRLDEDGHLVVLGRVDDVVVSGGVNVPLPAVARRLRAHPALEQVEVVGVPDEEWGQVVVACCVDDPDLAPGQLPDLAALRDWVADELPRAWAPRRLVRLDALPLLGNGKIDRQALLTAATAATAGEGVA